MGYIEFTTDDSDNKPSFDYDMEKAFNFKVLNVGEPEATETKKSNEKCHKFEVTFEASQGSGSFMCFKTFWTSSAASGYIKDFMASVGMNVPPAGQPLGFETSSFIGREGQFMMAFKTNQDGTTSKYREVRGRGGFIPKAVEEDVVPF